MTLSMPAGLGGNLGAGLCIRLFAPKIGKSPNIEGNRPKARNRPNPENRQNRPKVQNLPNVYIPDIGRFRHSAAGHSAPQQNAKYRQDRENAQAIKTFIGVPPFLCFGWSRFLICQSFRQCLHFGAEQGRSQCRQYSPPDGRLSIVVLQCRHFTRSPPICHEIGQGLFGFRLFQCLPAMLGHLPEKPVACPTLRAPR